jgi:hypothetical protein
MNRRFHDSQFDTLYSSPRCSKKIIAVLLFFILLRHIFIELVKVDGLNEKSVELVAKPLRRDRMQGKI